MSDKGKFLIFCIEQYRANKGLSGREVIMLFNEYGVARRISGKERVYTLSLLQLRADRGCSEPLCAYWRIRVLLSQDLLTIWNRNSLRVDGT